MADEGEEQLQLRAEIFRSKLIEHFHLLDNLSDNSADEVPKYYSDELKHDTSMSDMMRNFPNALVKFELYSHSEEMTYRDKRLNRIKTKNTIPLGPWAKQVVEDSKVQNFMLLLIISNSIVLGLQAEFAQSPKESYRGLKVFLDVFDYLSLMVFVLEILLKWLDEFVNFWKNGWNIFDFFVTVMSFVPELIRLSPGQNANQGVKIIADNLRTFRILRSLKMVSRFAQLRIIVLTILKALKSMVFILMLLGTFMYIFGVTGTVMFTAHAKSERTDVLYKDSFSNLSNSLLTLFQLFTLDHWYEILTDLGKASTNDFFSKAYILLWICVGSFIFRNVFTGIMVMNFQNIRNDFIMQCKEHELALKEEERKGKLEEELAKQYRTHSITARRKSSAFPSSVHSGNFYGTKLEIPHDVIQEEEEEDGTTGDIQNSENAAEIEKPDPAETNSDANENPFPKTNLEGTGERGDLRLASFSEEEPGCSEDVTSPKEQDNSEVQNKPDCIPEYSREAKSRPEDLPSTPKPAWGPSNLEEPEISINKEDIEDGSISSKEYKGSSVWNDTVTQNLTNMKNLTTETLWPRDSLFDYLQLLEALQDNLAERHQLQKLAALAINQLHDGVLK